MTIETLIQRGLDRFKGMPSERVTRVMAHTLLLHLPGSLPCELLANDHVYRYRFGRGRVQGRKPSTINREVGLLRTMLRDAGIKTNITKWYHETESPKTRVLGWADIDTLLMYLPKRQRDICIVLLGTGARIGEITHARRSEWKDDGEIGRLTVPEPKEGVEKVLLFTRDALLSARRLLNPGWGYAFCRYGKVPVQEYEVLRYHLRAASKKAGIAPVTAHDFRRTFASLALRNGVGLEQVAQVLGHKSLETTRRYARLDEKSKVEAIDAAMNRGA